MQEEICRVTGCMAALRAFDFISLSAVICCKVFCVHGGLSPSISAVDEINEIKKDPLPSASDLVWSDPGETNGWEESPRGSDFLFGPDIARQFNHENNIQFICRSHQLAMDGYSWNSNDYSVVCTKLLLPLW